MSRPNNEMARSSVKNGHALETKVLNLLEGGGWRCMQNQRIRSPLEPNSYIIPDIIAVRKDVTMYVECKYNGEVKGTMYQKLWYTIDVYGELNVPCLIVIDTANSDIKTQVISRLKTIAKPHVTILTFDELISYGRPQT